MALDIVTQDIIVDETTGIQDDDIDPSGSTNATLLYLLSLDDAGGMTSPEVAFQTNFVQATASAGETITSVVLTQNSSGTPFSTTVGVNSGIRTVDGNYVWLFQDPTNATVVIGVIGTDDPLAEPAETGPLAFSLGLVSTSTTNADLYTVQYVPLLHPDPALPDDRIDLTNKVFASVTGTSVASFLGSAAAPGNHDFYLINSSSDASKQLLVIGLDGGTANVSTQGFGVDNQSINPNETLQVDFVTGGTLNAGSSSQIQYGNHLETVTQAGFTINQVTPSNPDDRVDVRIAAFNNAGNEQGTDFFDGTTASSVNITSLKLTGESGFASTITANGTYATGSGNVTVSGLGTGIVTITGLDNVTTVDVTTSSPMDRLQVASVDANEGLDISEFHFSVTNTNAYSEEVGSLINFDDDGPSISTTGTPATLTVDETDLTTDASASFAAKFSSAFGADGAGTLTYALNVVAGPSGLVDTATNQAVVLSVTAGGVVEGRTAVSDDLVFTVSVDGTGNVTLDQKRAVVHTPDSGPDQSTTLAAANLVQLTATITDKDGDDDSATLAIGQNLVFEDDAPTITASGTEAIATVDESDLATIGTANFSSNFNGVYGADGAGTTAYALSVIVGESGLIDTLTGEAVNLSVTPGGVVEGRTAGGALVFTVTVDVAGIVTLNQDRAVIHDPNNGPNDTETLSADNLVQLTATITDKDGDSAAAVLNIGQNLVLTDDAPTIADQDLVAAGIQGFDGDPGTAGAQGETLTNAVGVPATGVFSFDIGADEHLAAFYTGGGSDFGDADLVAAGIQRLVLTGTVDNAQNSSITNISTSLTSETATSAVFAFSFHYDKDPITAGVQDATAGGTLTFDKNDGTYSIALNDVIDGFSFSVFHSSELLTKAPPGNTGHPELVVTELDVFDANGADNIPGNADDDTDGFYVQFTANSNPGSNAFGFNGTGDGNPIAGDTTFTNGQFVTSAFEDWVSATQNTNGVAGDTIQKGELLTLRFFNENILGDVNPGAPNGGTEKNSPTDAVDAIAIKFDGIGNAEDLVVVLDLIDYGADGVLGGTGVNADVETTKSVYVQNADFFKGNTVPAPYNSEFTLDRNDALVIIESNDYNATGEHFQIQGMQIMQSGNGLSGSAINLNRVTDNPGTVAVEGASLQTAGSLQPWEATDNDVLKITDIGFIQSTSGQIGADLDFAVNIQDADGDTTGIPHLQVDVIA
ncbi:DUF5801 repeats-in-toxin domain-containing protein [Mesorhizobium sp.]|uniref:DUF5801 repeats-in-toxin domain-containing protein n=1 Tax=Mesorhizobium sp. TaxID=1871066 RepID=UPI000FE90FF4|nr:DUF5801 repeats-in-toxin domain-containing protein [Mesorhizobium sp.]RWQ28517.1 MAG: hypothetical protein EOS19_15155 [Mesorhizobium sp.]